MIGSFAARSAASRGDELGLGHRRQHEIASFLRALAIDERRVLIRILDDAGDERGFGQREVADVLAEEDARRLGDAVQRKRAAIAEIDVVQIELEDLFLASPWSRESPP